MSAAPLDPALAAFIERARAARIETVASALKLRRAGTERVGPCPACGGRDRFAINPRKSLFNCRGCGARGDAIDLQMLLTGADFLAACAMLTGEEVPRGQALPDPAAIAAHQARIAAEAAARDRAREEDTARYREEARRRAFETWQRGERCAPGGLVERYFAARGIARPPLAAFRFIADHPYHHDGAPVGRGPAMLTPMLREDGRFAALHVTWLAPDGSGKARFTGPEGETLPAKKMFGPKRGAVIALDHGARQRHVLVIGEGIETVLSVRERVLAGRLPRLEGAAFRAAGDLGNLGGPAADSLRHPTDTVTDRLGRVRARKIAGPLPTGPEDDAIRPPAFAREIILLGDGDSDPIATRWCLERAARRFRRCRPGLVVRLAMAEAGRDFNDMLEAA